MPVRATEFKAGQAQKQRGRKTIVVHSKFYPLVGFFLPEREKLGQLKIFVESHLKPERCCAITMSDLILLAVLTSEHAEITPCKKEQLNRGDKIVSENLTKEL